MKDATPTKSAEQQAATARAPSAAVAVALRRCALVRGAPDAAAGG
eukprot:CAMPEP_0195144296 /NCGR_PEP_ID=MMETSP0448-20130528/167805_1 /TAXON_ID=66468 /ORGANISM="Heterocapsa triquestra, Strain CCMP 448" /LENGTH=44 /DNA_ID= /DNA_START= /DNA_END= /DNA_ORIENTATION=